MTRPPMGERGGVPGAEEFKAPIKTDIEKETEREVRPIEISADKVSIMGIELPRYEHRRYELSPEQIQGMEKFTIDHFSLDILQRAAKSVVLDQPLLLEGSQAAGKSYAVEYLAYLTNQDIHRMSLNGQTDVTDLIGKWVPRSETLRDQLWHSINTENLSKASLAILKRSKKIEVPGEGMVTLEPRAETIADENGNEKTIKFQFAHLTKEEMMEIASNEGIEIKDSDWIWQDGDIPRQMKEGTWSVLDEVNTCEPQILVRLNAVLEKGGQMILHEDGGKKVDRNPNFRLFATVNPPGAKFRGRVPLSMEWISRWNYQQLDKIPKKIIAGRIKSIFGVRVPKETVASIEADTEKRVRYVKPEAIKAGRVLVDYYEEEWLESLADKLAQVLEDLQELVAKDEIAVDQPQKFDYDQRDIDRFVTYLQRFRERGNLKQVIIDAGEFYFVNKCVSEDDREKVRTAMALSALSEPQEKSPEEQEDLNEGLRKIMGDILGLKTGHRDDASTDELADKLLNVR